MYHHWDYFTFILLLIFSIFFYKSTATQIQLDNKDTNHWYGVNLTSLHSATRYNGIQKRNPENMNRHEIYETENDIISSTFLAFIDLNSSLHICDSRFLSLTLDSGLIHHKYKGFDFESKQLQELANALSPSYVRLGGTMADFLTFTPKDQNHEDWKSNDTNMASCDEDFVFDHLSEQPCLNKKPHNYTMSGDLWKRMAHFFNLVEWDVVFDFNLFKWKNDGFWDSQNAELLLNFSDALSYNISGFQLGNEPNSFLYNFNFSIDPPLLAKDFHILKKTISKFPRYQKSQLFGPDVTDLVRHSSSSKYLKGFLQAGGSGIVSEISLHQYYINGRTATVNDFVDPQILDEFKREIETAYEIIKKYSHPIPIRFTETSSCYGGGAPGLSDAYVAGFMWLDKLGLAARYGVTKVFRQSFYKGNYALLTMDCQPNPDYFLSLLHKRLILGPVFNMTVSPGNTNLRIYAHCSRADFYKFPNGSISLAYLNVDKVDHTISLPQFPNQSFYLYSLTPGDSNGLKSRFVKLNGHLLQMSGDKLPPLEPKELKGKITLKALTFGFIVIPKANISLCEIS